MNWMINPLYSSGIQGISAIKLTTTKCTLQDGEKKIMKDTHSFFQVVALIVSLLTVLLPDVTEAPPLQQKPMRYISIETC